MQDGLKYEVIFPKLCAANYMKGNWDYIIGSYSNYKSTKNIHKSSCNLSG